jgi:hypothetical protein
MEDISRLHEDFLRGCVRTRGAKTRGRDSGPAWLILEQLPQTVYEVNTL